MKLIIEIVFNNKTKLSKYEPNVVALVGFIIVSLFFTTLISYTSQNKIQPEIKKFEVLK